MNFGKQTPGSYFCPKFHVPLKFDLYLIRWDKTFDGFLRLAGKTADRKSNIKSCTTSNTDEPIWMKL